MRVHGFFSILLIGTLLCIGGCTTADEGGGLENPETPEGIWLLDHIHVLESANPESPSDVDLQPLLDQARQVRIIGMGEATHGTGPFFASMHRIFRALAAHENYRLVILEMNFMPFYQLNQYVVHDRGSLNEWFTGPYFQEYTDLIEWMHEANLNRSENQKLWLLGCDILSYRSHIEDILEMVTEVDSNLLATLTDLYAEFQTWTSGFDYHDQAPEAIKKRIRADIREAHEAIIAGKNRLVDGIGEWEYSFLERAAAVVIQSEDFFSNVGSPEVRDRYMTDNIQWLIERFGQPKALVYAHNEHVALRARDDLYGRSYDSIGYFLRQAHGSQYFCIGQTFYEGTFHTYWGTGRVGPPLDTSYEFIFEQARRPFFFLNLRGLDTSAEAARWIEGPRPLRHIDERFQAGFADEDTFNIRSIVADFDGIVYIRDSTPYRMAW